jgi:hypothetical protein
MTCVAPSLILTPDAARELGLLAESVAGAKYLKDMGRPAFFPAPPATDFFDISHGFGNTSLYAAFLGARFTSLTPDRLVQLSDDKLLKIPDLATDVPSQREFYEVKPGSSSGISAGRRKIANIQGFYSRFSVPLVAGVQWSPDFRFRLFQGGLLGLEVDVFLHFWRPEAALVLYEVCAEGRTRRLTNAEVAMIIAAVLLAVLAEVFSGGAATPVLVPLLAI